MRSTLITILVIALLSFTGCTAATKTPTIDEVAIALVPLALMVLTAYEFGHRRGRKDGP